MRKIREIRKLKGDTLKELADKVQYDFSNLSKRETINNVNENQ
jgi:transcriptional regulator with XRE-family HTH domain